MGIGLLRLGVVRGWRNSSGDDANGATTPTATATLSPTPTVAELGQTYLVLVSLANAAGKTYNDQRKALGAYPTVSQLQTIATPLAEVLQTFNNALLREPWPASMLPDIHTEATAVGTMIGDLQNAGAPTPAAWGNQFNRDASAFGTAANIVRSDLGLPPPPSLTPS